MNAVWLLAAEEAGHHSGPVGPAQVIFSPFGFEVTSPVVTEWFVIAVITILAFAATRRLRRIPGRFQAGVELVVNGLIDGVFAPTIGSREKAIRYLPFLGTLFLFIIISNYTGLLPGAVLHLPGFKPPTSELSVTVALALLAFAWTHGSGIRQNGLRYFGHFLKPYPWLLPLNIIEELVRPLSLSLRLFGNIFGGETVLWVLLSLFPWFVPIPIMGLEIFFGFLQAFIFTSLTAVYIGAATAEHH